MTTYAIYGYSEWQTTLAVGNERVKIHFTGGSVNQYGAIPAEYSTAVVAVQQAIEATAYFKRGRIKRISETDEPEVAQTSPEVPLEPKTSEPAKELTFACIEDAALYMMEEFGCAEEAVISPDDIAALAAAHNLKITF